MRNILVEFSIVIISGLPAQAYIDLQTEEMGRDRLISLISDQPNVTTLDQVPALFPEEFLMNFILKHGIKRTGERGHPVETKVSQSADPLLPRAIIFDERTGFSVSYNGGGPEQKANQRLDILSFDHSAKTFNLEQIDFPIRPGHPHLTTSDCKTCHGPNQRPIFSMYPDWPSFYGSDNDELTGNTVVQKAEFADYKKFRAQVASLHPRYSPLFSAERVRKNLGRDIYASFPYRPDNSTQVRNVSRAFAFRPELRMGILYNRLTAQHVAARIIGSSRYSEFGTYFLFNLLQCGWSANGAKSAQQWQIKAEKLIGEKAKVLTGGLLDYRQNLKIFDLLVNDIDIRYSYTHPGYANQDASKKVMEIGYIGRYFNSYFDGSATIDELVAAKLYQDLSTRNSTLKGIISLWGLIDKYKHLQERFRYDRHFFTQMDQFGKWIHIPYPQQLASVHHRETFTAEFAQQHTRLCQALEKELK